MKLNSTKHTRGRFGNHLYRNLAFNFIAKINQLRIEYSFIKEMNELGIFLYSGEKTYTETIEVHDDNFFSMINTSFQKNIVVSGSLYCQTSDFAKYLHNYFHSEIKESVIKANHYKERYKNNEDVFIHVRLDDASHLNPGFQYYDSILSQIPFLRGFISSDSISNLICKELIEKYNLTVLNENEVNTIMFGSTCKYIILSNGTFSWWIGTFGFYSEIWYPKVKIAWHGDIFVIPSWHAIEV
jgi:hypothetical protein